MNRVLLLSLLVLAIGSAACNQKKEPVANIAERPTPAATKPPTILIAEATPQTTASPKANTEDSADGVPAEMEVKDSAESRFGKLRVAAKEGDPHHKLYFNGKEISEYEGPIRLYEVFNGQDRDYVVGANDSGGIACPLAPFILEIYDREKSEHFDDFGDCRGDVKAKFVDDKVILEIPPYFPHPDLIPKKELKEGMKKMEVFIWAKGRLLSQETRPMLR